MSSHPQLRIGNPIIPSPRPKTSRGKSGAGQLNLLAPDAKPSIDPELIRAQVERIVASQPFRKSSRHQRLLRFIVDQTLAGNSAQLKERTLGTEVFDRAADYELRTDPVVRVAAGELRKRLAQYYVQNDSESQLRIELQPGSYVPEFHWPRPVSANSTVPFRDSAAHPPATTLVETRTDRNHERKWVALTAFLFISALTAVFILKLTSHPSSTETFWGPLLKADASPIICIGDRHQLLSNTPSISLPGLPDPQTSYWPSIFEVNIANQTSQMFTAHGKRAFIQDSSLTSLEQLSRQPVVLIGWRNNQWSERAMQLLRFRLMHAKGSELRTIVDTQHPSQPRWMVDPKDSAPNRTGETYAIIARFIDPAIGQPTILIAGIGIAGTTAAARFITNDPLLQTFATIAPRGWHEKNIELVIETHVVNGINGASGPPHLIASYVW